MNKLVKIIATVSSLSLLSLPAVAGEAEIEWVKPEKFTDIRPATESRSHMQKRVIKAFNEHFSKLAKKLPEGQTLKVSVSNLDLAGHVHYMVGPNNETVRIVKDLYFPRMVFDYQLVDSDGTVMSAAKEKIKDMSFMYSIQSSKNTDSFHYEKNMINDWFYKTFPETRKSK